MNWSYFECLSTTYNRGGYIWMKEATLHVSDLTTELYITWGPLPIARRDFDKICILQFIALVCRNFANWEIFYINQTACRRYFWSKISEFNPGERLWGIVEGYHLLCRETMSTWTYLHIARGSLHSIDGTPPHYWWCSSTELMVLPTVLRVSSTQYRW